LKVGLTGFYGYGNFGDDLMAVLFGLALRQAGVDFSVYKLCRNVADSFGFRTANSAEDLLADAQLLLWGGGGLLVSWSAFTYELLYRGVSRDYDRLIEMAGRRGCRFCALSVGGTGECPPRLIPGYKQAFLNAAEYISVRNPQDVYLLKKHGVQGDYFPDLVWQTADHFPFGRHHRGTTKIGVDIYLSNLARKHALHILPLLWMITRIRSDCEFTFLDTTNRSMRPYRGAGRLIRGRNVRCRQFSDLAADLEFLASLDLLISTRLHTPMICMGYGVPAVSLFGEKKTALLMKNLDLSCLSIGHRELPAFASLLVHKARLSRFLEQFHFPDVSKLRNESYGHQKRLRAILGIGDAPAEVAE
jgi:polysaccharide pyruvyl transferase WcaK-like protein